MENNKKVMSTDVKRLCGMAIFVALAVVATILTKWLQIAHLTFDAKDAVITIAAYIYGPLPALAMSLATSMIESLTFGGDTGWFGFLMNFFSTAAFSLTASIIYMKKRDINGALIGLLTATVVTTGVMLLLNVFIAPLYFGLPLFAPYIMNMLPTLLLPFNFAKALMNSAIAMYLYKPVLAALREAKLIEGSAKNMLTFNRNSKIILFTGIIVIAVSAAIFLILLNAQTA
ncbi:MAG: ECF transporter S component [Ruminococcaceae bacterium]|nr:ECF transporter S component [Oscillospiraceae bacterium]